MFGNLSLGGYKITNVADPISTQDISTNSYVDISVTSIFAKAGDTMVGAVAMSGYKIAELGDPTLAQDAATQNYVDSYGCPKFTIVTRTLPNTTNSDVTIYTLPTGKTVVNSKIWICGLWVERESWTWINSDCAQFTAQFTNFYLFSRGATILFYTSAIPPVSGWTRNFRLHVLEFR